MDDLALQVLAIQRSYLRVYHACHTRHLRRPASEHRLSESDHVVLVHLDARRGTRPGELAAHLGLAASSLSATVARLAKLGLIARGRSRADGRAAELVLTPRGIAALQATSVLDTARLGAVLGRLRPRERRIAVEGLEKLATAAQELLADSGSATRWSRAGPTQARPGPWPDGGRRG